MTSLGKKTAPHWFLPVPEVSQTFQKNIPGSWGRPGAHRLVWVVGSGARKQPVTGMQLSRLPVLHLGATSGCAVLCTIVEESSLQASTHARTQARTHGRVPCTLEHSCTECARGAVRQSGAGWRWGRACSGGFVPLVPLLRLGRESGNQGRRNRTTGGAGWQEEGEAW